MTITFELWGLLRFLFILSMASIGLEVYLQKKDIYNERSEAFLMFSGCFWLIMTIVFAIRGFVL